MTDTLWHRDEQQATFISQVFDLEIHAEPIRLTLDGIDHQASLAHGQNRVEMVLDEDTVELIALYMADEVSFPMPLVWKATPKSRRYVVLDGNHRIKGSLVKRGDPSLPAVLVTGETQVAQRLAMVVNLQHGRSTRDPSYLAVAMRTLRDDGVPVAQVARVFGVSDAKVKTMTRRDVQAERVRRLVPERRAAVRAHVLDLLGNLEDAHVTLLGETFLDATKAAQEEVVRKLKDAPSAMRDQLAHEVLGELREAERQRTKAKAVTSKPSSNLQGALQRLVGVDDHVRAYFQSTDHQKAIMRSNLGVVMPRLSRLWQTVAGLSTEVA